MAIHGASPQTDAAHGQQNVTYSGVRFTRWAVPWARSHAPATRTGPRGPTLEHYPSFIIYYSVLCCRLRSSCLGSMDEPFSADRGDAQGGGVLVTRKSRLRGRKSGGDGPDRWHRRTRRRPWRRAGPIEDGRAVWARGKGETRRFRQCATQAQCDWHDLEVVKSNSIGGDEKGSWPARTAGSATAGSPGQQYEQILPGTRSREAMDRPSRLKYFGSMDWLWTARLSPKCGHRRRLRERIFEVFFGCRHVPENTFLMFLIGPHQAGGKI